MQNEQALSSVYFQILKPRKALNKTFLKVNPNRAQIKGFIGNLIELLDRINDTESEVFHKNSDIDFRKKTWYVPNYIINTVKIETYRLGCQIYGLNEEKIAIVENL